MRLAHVLDAALEATVVGSFTRLGYDARRRLYDWTPLEELRLDGKTAIVTGATSGLGREAAELLGRQGAHVCIVGRDPAEDRAGTGRASGLRGRRRRPLVARRDAHVRGRVRSAARPPRRARAERRRADPRLHRHRRGLRGDAGDARALPVPADSRAPAPARGRPVGARDLGRIGRHVPRTARRRRTAADRRRPTTASRRTPAPSARRSRSPRNGRASSPARTSR